jgi:hypothetical protein
MVRTFLLFLFAPTLSFVAQDSVSVADVFMACGNKYFSDNETSQPAMVVRGKFCGNMYYWTPPVMGDSLTQQAFRNDLPFTGRAVDFDLDGNIIGAYSFENGYLQHLEEFYKGIKRVELAFINGIPHGAQTENDHLGALQRLLTFRHGVLEGPFYMVRYQVDQGLPDCVMEGTYHEGKEVNRKSTCSD